MYGTEFLSILVAKNTMESLARAKPAPFHGVLGADFVLSAIAGQQWHKALIEVRAEKREWSVFPGIWTPDTSILQAGARLRSL